MERLSQRIPRSKGTFVPLPRGCIAAILALESWIVPLICQDPGQPTEVKILSSCLIT